MSSMKKVSYCFMIVPARYALSESMFVSQSSVKAAPSPMMARLMSSSMCFEPVFSIIAFYRKRN